MGDYFADSSFWIAIVDKRDQYHAQAIEWSLKLRGRVVTTQAVLLETANALSRPAWREQGIALIEHVLSRPDTITVSLSDALWKRAWTLYCDRLDKAWSLTDCISFEVMREHGLVNALTADSHFKQAGYHAILLER